MWTSVVVLGNYITKNLLASCRELIPKQQEWGGWRDGLAKQRLKVNGSLLQVWKEEKQMLWFCEHCSGVNMSQGRIYFSES